MIDVTGETTIVASPLRMVLMGLLGIVMTGVSFATAWPLLPNVEPGSLAQFAGWFGVIFFAACTVVIFSRAFGKNRPTLVLSPAGFRFNSVSSETIAWRSVTHLGEWKFQRQRMLVVGVTEDVWRSPHLTRTTRWTRNANQKFGVDGLAIPSTGMPMRFEDMAETFAAYWRAYGDQNRTAG